MKHKEQILAELEKIQSKEERLEYLGDLLHRAMKRKLEKLIRSWRRSQRIYETASCDQTASRSSRARYEGESIAFRWCREDLEHVMKSIKPERPRKSK